MFNFNTPTTTAVATAPIFGSGFGSANPPATTTSIFGSGFGAATTTTAPATTGLFGTQPSAAAPSLFSGFGTQPTMNSSQPAQPTTLFGGSGQPQPAQLAVSGPGTASSNVFSRLGEAKPAATGFSFGQPPTIPSSSATTAAPSLAFNFTAPQPTAASTAPSIFSGTTSSTTQPSLFGFTAPAATTAPSLPSFSFLTTPVSNQPAPLTGFSLPVAAPAPTAAAVAPVFSFGTSTLPSTSTASAAAPSGFSFGIPSATSAQPSLAAAPSVIATTAAPSFSFNFNPATTTATGGPGSASSSLFSHLAQPISTAAPLSFGLPSSVPIATNTTTPAPFNFGLSATSNAPVATVPSSFATPVFGLPTVTTTARIPSAPAALPAAQPSFPSFSAPAPLNLTVSAPATIAPPTLTSFTFAPVATTSAPASLSMGFLPPAAASVTTAAASAPPPAFSFSIPAPTASSVVTASSGPGFSFGILPSVISTQPAVTPASTAVTTVISSTPAPISSIAPLSLGIPSLASISTALPSTTVTSTAITLPVTTTSSDMSEEDKNILDRFKKMTYDNFEAYLEDTKRAVDQLEESWIRGTLKLNAFLSMRKDNTKSMRSLRDKLAAIWEFENKVERTLAAVSLSIAEIEETLSYLEKHATDSDEFFKKNARRISAEDRYRANCYKTLDLLYREVRIALNDVDSSRKKLMRNLIKEDEVRDLLTSKQMLSGQFDPKLLMENPHVLGTISTMLMKDVKEVKNGQRQALTKLRFQKAQADAQSR